MSMSDPIADMLTRIRNAFMRKHAQTIVPYSRIKHHVLNVMQDEGFIEKWDLHEDEKFNQIVVHLKYDCTGDSVIRKIRRISKPGLRVHRGVNEIHPVLNGQGITVVSTSYGVLSDRECRKQNVGGEVLCEIW